ncbi:DUF374 domain-containing protein [Botrimarina hoheduenensis]|uniref:DUF374 domain-containing protein n=1 Tax=Botrimarina hoheduenensis TaxID=2528000 RepID=A0A5C5VZG7_9BACT|nr:DUF374 domain-containing protein [Botrimarina hoheduenensis]TWT43161.1 hypothetical protein Pla111_21110 [Botrimarina hoheduenensis]
MRIPTSPVGWLIAAYVLLLRWTCRVRTTNDPRPGLRQRGEAYSHAILHAHQLAIGSKGEPGTMAMASQSADGELLVPTFRVLGVPLARGSNARNGRDRGGTDALAQMVQHVRGGGNTVIAVDGPRGPRGRVRKGIASLSQQTNTPIVCVIVKPTWRLVIGRAWDRFQVPLPFTRFDAYFGPLLRPEPDETVESLRRRVEETLRTLEVQHDPRQADTPSADSAAQPDPHDASAQSSPRNAA